MKANELMIGAFLRVNRDGLCIKKGTIVEVRGIDADNVLENHIGSATCRPLDKEQSDGGIWCDFLDPIPLTPKILDKNGFQTDQFFSSLNIGKWMILCDTKRLTIINRDCSDEERCNMDINISYVHELQHALRLCGIDKTIEL